VSSKIIRKEFSDIIKRYLCEINELGIDPIQIYGFGFFKGIEKNAADIQLTIDAVELALTRPTIKVFVIIFGDGGFTALVKKMHEYGKTVMKCDGNTFD